MRLGSERAAWAWVVVCATVTALLAVAAIALGAVGDLDPSFNGGQPIVVSAGPAGSATTFSAVAKQADGKVIVVGSTDNGTGTGYGIWVIERFGRDGQPDSGFGTGGMVKLDMGAGSATGVVVQASDQRIVVGGTSGPLASGTAELVRLNIDGSLDGSFGSGGKVALTSAAAKVLSTGKLVVGPDGKLFLAASASDPSSSRIGAIASATSSGAPNGWGTGGIVVVPTGSGAKSPTIASVVVAGATVFYGGSAFDSSFVSQHGLLGAVDTSTGAPVAGFGSSGLVTLGQSTAINDILLAADGKLKVTGYSPVAGAPGTGTMIASFNTSGASPADRGFGSGGAVAVGGVAGAPNNGNAITEVNGQLFAASTAVLADSSTQIALVAVDEKTGALNTGLGPGGYRVYSFGAQSYATGIADPGQVQNPFAAIVGAAEKDKNGPTQGVGAGISAANSAPPHWDWEVKLKPHSLDQVDANGVVQAPVLFHLQEDGSVLYHGSAVLDATVTNVDPNATDPPSPATKLSLTVMRGELYGVRDCRNQSSGKETFCTVRRLNAGGGEASFQIIPSLDQTNSEPKAAAATVEGLVECDPVGEQGSCANNTSYVRIQYFLPPSTRDFAKLSKPPKSEPATNLRQFAGTVQGGAGKAIDRASQSALAASTFPTAHVEIAVLRIKKAGSCLWLASSRATFRRRPAAAGLCAPLWLRALGSKHWSFKLTRALPKGRYAIVARAVGPHGKAQTRFGRASVATFRLT